MKLTFEKTSLSSARNINMQIHLTFNLLFSVVTTFMKEIYVTLTPFILILKISFQVTHSKENIFLSNRYRFVLLMRTLTYDYLVK